MEGKGGASVSSGNSLPAIPSNFRHSNHFRVRLSLRALGVALNPFFSIRSALFAHSFALRDRSSPFFSIACALFAKTWGVYPNNLRFGTSAQPLATNTRFPEEL